MSEKDWFPFKDEAEEKAYVKKMGLDKYACSKHGLDYEFTCTECHDQWQKWVEDNNINVVSEYGSTSRIHLIYGPTILKAEESKDD